MQLKTMLLSPGLRCALCSPILPRRVRTNAFSSSSSPQYQPWSGLQRWRESSLNENRKWGSSGPEQLSSSSTQVENDPTAYASSLAELGTLVLSTSDPLTKSGFSHLAYSRWRSEHLPLGVSKPPDRPARPPKPHLVSPKEIPAPKNSGLPLNAYMLHNLAHVELNAIDLAWDTVVRFSPYSEVLGEGFFADFAHVADDESRHFAWCSQRLAELGFSYGDMPAHNLLWRECEKSSGDVAARLAVIPLVQFLCCFQHLARYFPPHSLPGYFHPHVSLFQEARGLDAGPRLVQKLVGFGDLRTSKIVARIAEEEVAHVAVGVFWFLSVCQKMGRTPCTTFKDLLNEYNVELKGPFNYSARDEAGIPRDWYDGSFVNKLNKNERLTGVYERLACIISMEKENSNLSSKVP